MRQRTFARRIAEGLATCRWTRPAVEAHLRQVLPARYRRYAPRMAASLVEGGEGQPSPAPATLARELWGVPHMSGFYLACRRSGQWPAPYLGSPEMEPSQAFAGLDLPPLATCAELADWLLVPPGRLDHFADVDGRAEAAGETAINHHVYRLLPKPRGGRRLIEAPKPGLRGLQRRILRGMLDRVPAHPAAHGFVAGRNCVDAAALHAGEAAVVCFDLADFFGSIGGHRVYGLFRAMGYPHGVALALRGLTTTRTPPWMLERLPSDRRQALRAPHLAQGAPTSPALANLTAYRLDRRLAGLARSLDARYTRYADDLAFSGDAGIVAPLLRVVPDIAAEEGFRVAPAKTRVRRAGQRQTVTGIVVNRHVNVPREDYDLLKAILHACARPEDRRLADPAFRKRLSGRIGWVEQVNPARGARLRDRLDALLEGSGA